MTHEQQQALDKLYENKNILTYQQYRTFRGQIKTGDVTGFHKGIDRIIKEKENAMHR